MSKLQKLMKQYNQSTPGQESGESGQKETKLSRIMKAHSADVDESTVRNFILDSGNYQQRRSQTYNDLDWQTGSTSDSSLWDNEESKNMTATAKKVRTWAWANKDQLDAEYFTNLTSYVEDFLNYQTQSTIDYRLKTEGIKEYKTQEEYDQAVQASEWYRKYQGKNYSQLQSVISQLPDGAEKDWLTAYAPTVKTTYEYSKDEMQIQRDLSTLLMLKDEDDNLRKIVTSAATDSEEYQKADSRRSEIGTILRREYGSDDWDALIDSRSEELRNSQIAVKFSQLRTRRGSDFEEKSQYLDTDNWLSQVVNNPEIAKAIDTTGTLAKGILHTPGKLGIDDAVHVYEDQFYQNLHLMEKEERENFNYLFNTEGEDAAKEYLDTLQKTLNARSQANISEWVTARTQDNWAAPIYTSLLSTPLKFAGGAPTLMDVGKQKIKNFLTDETVDYNRDAMIFGNAANAIRSSVGGQIVESTGQQWLGDAYNLGMSMNDSAVVAIATAINPIAGKVASLLLSASAAADTMQAAAANGASDNQAITLGLAAGFFEFFFEKYEIGSLMKNKGEKIVEALLKQSFSEAVGEGATELCNIVMNAFVMAEKSDITRNAQAYLQAHPDWTEGQARNEALKDAAIQILKASGGGLLSGGFMGSGAVAVNTGITNYQENQNANNIYGESQQELVTEALELDPDNAYAQKLQGRLDSGKNLSGAQLRKLAAQNEAEIRNIEAQNQTSPNAVQPNAAIQAATNQTSASTNPAEVAGSLQGKGIPSHKIDPLAEAIVARVNGQELTQTQKDILRFELGSPTVQSVISDIMIRKASGVDSARNNVYDEINTIGGNENGQEATLWNLSNQRADGSLQSLQTQTRAEDGNGSGVPGTLRENKGLPHATLPAEQRRGLTSDLDAFSDSDYATVTEGSALHQVQNAFKEEYGIECYIIKNSSWTRSSPAYSRNGVVYIREGIDLGTLSTAVPHEATHIMKQKNFQPYVEFISRTPDLLNFQSATIEGLLDIVAEHKNINPFTADDQQLFNFYDELNSIVYGLYKSGVLANKDYNLSEAIPGVFNDFTSYIQEMDRIHEQFKNQHTLAEAIVARVNGQELTRTQSEILSFESRRPLVQNIISDLIQKKSNGVDSASNDVYDGNIRDGIPNEQNDGLQNLSDQGVDVFSNHDNGTVIDGAALQQFQNAFSEEIHEGGASVPRPTWRQSELDAVADFPEYKAQKSFMNGKEVPYGTKGSVRPDYYKSGFSVDIKNYNVESTSSRSNLARNIETQYSQRIENLPDGTKQAVLIDVRGQKVSISALLVLYNDIIQRTNNGVEVLFKIN